MSWQNERRFREEIVHVHRKLYELGFSVANDGNTSVRLDNRRVLITPRGLNKATLEPNQIATVGIDGQPISGNFPPSTEIAVHIGVYNARPDVSAIVHAHPPFCIACSMAGVSLNDYFLPEVILTLGKIPTARYATTGTVDAGTAVVEWIGNHDAVILDRHGTVTVGSSLEDALSKLERIEHTAKIVAIARMMGHVERLPQTEIERLLKMREGMSPEMAVEAARAKYEKPRSSALAQPDPNLIELIAKQVKLEIANRRGGKDNE